MEALVDEVMGLHRALDRASDPKGTWGGRWTQIAYDWARMAAHTANQILADFGEEER